MFRVQAETDEGDRVEMSNESEAEQVAARAANCTLSIDEDEDSISKFSRYQASKALRRRLLAAMPDDPGMGLQRQKYRYHFEGDTVCKVTTSLDSYEQVLAHRDERTDEHLYEDGDKRPAVRVNFNIGPLPEAEANAVKDALLQPAMTTIGRWSAIEKVRVKECAVTKTGDCFL